MNDEYADRVMIVYDDAKQRYVSVTSDKRRWPFYEDALIHEAKLEEQRRYIRTVAKYTSTMPINIVRRPHLFCSVAKN